MYNSWLSQLSCALQKANVACLRSASAARHGPAPGARAEGAGAVGADGAEADDDWLEEAVEDLLQWAAASVGVDLR